MELHYNAFISYKHAPADIAVAREIQRRLEHFHVPKAIRQKTGRQKIERIFRDQAELPITSDLSRDLVRALNDAEFLIVICSTSTKYSTWVPREIEQFLKTHDRNHVLTVLVDGEPNDVIPSVLREETVITEDAFGNATEQKQVFEPLSCDCRDMKTARRSEIPRLAAALLGCSYDELVMRARQYKMRRLAVFASAAAVLISVAIGYLIWSNRQIRSSWQQAEENRLLAEANYAQAEENRLLAEANYAQAEENLAQAYRNQSVYLANESLNATKAENRILAAQLALAALPSAEHPERPYTAVAEYALHKAIDSYTIRDYITYRAVWNMSTRGSIASYMVDRGQRIAFAYDYSGYVYAWDLSGHQTLFTLQTDRSISSIHIVHVGSRLCLVVADRNTITLYDGVSGESIWTYEKDASHSFDTYADQDRIFVFDCVSGSDARQSTSDLLYVIELDPASGAEVFRSGPSRFESDRSNLSAVLDDEGKKIYYASKRAKYDALGCCSFETGEVETYPLDAPFASLFTMLPLSDGRVVLYGISDGVSAYSMNGMIELEQTIFSVRCVDTQTGETLWDSRFASSALQYLQGRKSCFACEAIDASGTSHALIAVIYGNEIFFFDQNDGSQYTKFKTDSEIVNVDFTADGSHLIIEEHNGHFVYYLPGDTSALSIDMFRKELYDVELSFTPGGQWVFTVKADSKRLQVYENIWDENLLPFDGAATYANTNLQRLTERDRMFVMMRGSYYTNSLTFDLYDMDTKTLTKRFSHAFDGSDVNMVGMDPACRYLVAQTGYPPAVYTFDVESGRMIGSFDPARQFGSSRTSDCMMVGDRLYLSIENPESSTKNSLLCLRLQSDGSLEEEQLIDIPDTLLSPGITVDDRETMLMLYETNANVKTYSPLLCDPASGRWISPEIVLANGVPDMDFLGAEQLLAFNDSQKAVVCGLDGKQLYEIRDIARTIVSVRFCGADDAGTEEDLLLVLSLDDQYHLDRYAAKDGRFLGSTSLDNDASYVEQASWLFSDGELILNMDGTLNIVDLSEWTICLSAGNVAYYSPSRRMLYIQSPDNDYLLMYAPRCTLPELVEMGKRFLKGDTLSESERAAYGIDP